MLKLFSCGGTEFDMMIPSGKGKVLGFEPVKPSTCEGGVQVRSVEYILSVHASRHICLQCFVLLVGQQKMHPHC